MWDDDDDGGGGGGEIDHLNIYNGGSHVCLFHFVSFFTILLLIFIILVKT